MGKIRAPLLKRFLSKVRIRSKDECWEWTGGKFTGGYGCFKMAGSAVWIASRVSFLLSRGFIDPTLQVCHTCDNIACVNPSHLWLGDQSSNQLDSVAKRRHISSRKTHCKNGHEFGQENQVRVRDHRDCLTCARARNRFYRQQKRQLSGSAEF